MTKLIEFLIFLIIIKKVQSLGGIFELNLKKFENPSNRDSEGHCCNRIEKDCVSKCESKFRICVKNYQVNIDPSGGCYFGEVESGIIRFYEKKDNVFHFPFNFRWPGTFSLIIEALSPSKKNESTLLTRMAIQQYLYIGPVWKGREWKSPNGMTLEYAYRVRCLPDYYGEACDKTCRPRDDTFGHYNCNEFGEVQCLKGWSGEYCEEATCPPSCSPQHATCTTPSTCTCHQGWEGPSCTTCTPYPGCKHGRCTLPYQCECEEGWGGLFCNQDLNYCTNHAPCLNGGTCFNTGQGSYTCECKTGFTGSDCEFGYGFGSSNKCDCSNGGSCRDNGTHTFCSCPEPYTGPKCTEISFNCNVQGCLNNAPCIDSTCVCPDQYSGPSCANKSTINICATSPCANGGLCAPTDNNSFNCTCKNGFGGLDCSEFAERIAEKLEDLSPSHVLFVVLISIATPLMVVVAVGVVLALKKRKLIEQRRNDELARKQNELNSNVQKDYIINEIKINKRSNLDVDYRLTKNASIPDLLIDPYNPPPPCKMNNQHSPVILVKNVNLATSV